MLQFAGIASLGPSQPEPQRQTTADETARHASDILETTSYELKLDKSNILMLGPTGTGKTNNGEKTRHCLYCCVVHGVVVYSLQLSQLPKVDAIFMGLFSVSVANTYLKDFLYIYWEKR
jgi:hypothetical protein